MQTKILVVEDETQTREALRSVLTASGYHVLATDLVATALHLFTREEPALAVLDLSLPDGNGLELCKKIRGHAERGRIPVIILTADADFETKISGIRSGADQYLVKPVPPREMLLWIEALLRRLEYDSPATGRILCAAGCEIDPDAHLVRYKGETVSDLTGKEFDLLYYLVRKRPSVLSRKHILSRLWHTIAVDRLVDSHLHNLRKKLPPELAERIQAVPGKGFRFLE